MATNQTKQHIQQMEQGQKDFGIIKSVQNIHRKIVNNDIISQFDVFSVPVKLTLNGNQVYQTCCGGLMNLLLLALCIVITIFILFPTGVQLNSEIAIAVAPNNGQNTGTTLFDNTDQIISWRGLKRTSSVISGYANVSLYATFKAYQMGSDNVSYPLDISTDCTEGAQYCIKKTTNNLGATIYGNFYNKNMQTKYIVIEQIWCNTSVPLSCPSASGYAVQYNLTNFFKKKGGNLMPTTTRICPSFTNVVYTANVTKEIYTSNTYFLGHLANLFPFSKQTLLFSDYTIRSAINQTLLVTPSVPTTFSFAQIRFTPNGISRQITQNFDDVSDIILFFLSIKETFYLVIFFMFIKHYNRNAGLLEIAHSLFYIDDPNTKKKYNFKKGPQAFLACLLYNHPVSKLFNFMLTKCGKTFDQVMPNKAFCAIKLMRKTQEILQQNAFYGNLNQLSSMQSEACRRIQLVEEQENQKQEQTQLSYFPFLPTDSEPMRKQKEILRQAFDQFCYANEFISADRKNHVYNVISNRKLKHMLAHQMQKQFKQFVRNTRIQKSQDIYQMVENQETSQIKVAIHDVSNNQMTAQNFIRT